MARRTHSPLSNIALGLALIVIAGYTAFFAFLIRVADTSWEWRVDEWTRLGIISASAMALSFGPWAIGGFMSRRSEVILCAGAGVTLVGAIVLDVAGGPFFKPHDGEFLVAGTALLSVCATLADQWRPRRVDGTCIKCGYNLTGLPNARCPECGHTVSPFRRA